MEFSLLSVPKMYNPWSDTSEMLLRKQTKDQRKRLLPVSHVNSILIKSIHSKCMTSFAFLQIYRFQKYPALSMEQNDELIVLANDSLLGCEFMRQ